MPEVTINEEEDIDSRYGDKNLKPAASFSFLPVIKGSLGPDNKANWPSTSMVDHKRSSSVKRLLYSRSSSQAGLRRTNSVQSIDNSTLPHLKKTKF
jgi:hypothetical protein